MIIIADSSALIALSTCRSLPLLEQLFDQVCVPQAVYDEVCTLGKVESRELQQFLHDRVHSVTLENHPVNKPDGLGSGEIEAIALYTKLSASLLLIDDAKAKKVAYANGIEVMGSLGVLLMAKKNGLIPQIAPLLKLLIASDVYFGEKIIDKVLTLAEETF